MLNDSLMAESEYELVVIGSGPAAGLNKLGAARAASIGTAVALLDRSFLSGTPHPSP